MNERKRRKYREIKEKWREGESNKEKKTGMIDKWWQKKDLLKKKKVKEQRRKFSEKIKKEERKKRRKSVRWVERREISNMLQLRRLITFPAPLGESLVVCGTECDQRCCWPISHSSSARLSVLFHSPERTGLQENSIAPNYYQCHIPAWRQLIPRSDFNLNNSQGTTRTIKNNKC